MKIKSDLTSHTRSCIPSTLRYVSVRYVYHGVLYNATRNWNSFHMTPGAHYKFFTLLLWLMSNTQRSIFWCFVPPIKQLESVQQQLDNLTWRTDAIKFQTHTHTHNVQVYVTLRNSKTTRNWVWYEVYISLIAVPYLPLSQYPGPTSEVQIRAIIHTTIKQLTIYSEIQHCKQTPSAITKWARIKVTWH